MNITQQQSQSLVSKKEVKYTHTKMTHGKAFAFSGLHGTLCKMNQGVLLNLKLCKENLRWAFGRNMITFLHK